MGAFSEQSVRHSRTFRFRFCRVRFCRLCRFCFDALVIRAIISKPGLCLMTTHKIANKERTKLLSYYMSHLCKKPD